MTKRKQTVGDAQKAAGLPSDTLKNPSGANARDDQHLSTFEKRHGKAAIAEQLAPKVEGPIEHIICAAIHYPDQVKHEHQPKNIETGFVVCGRRHHNVIAVVFDLANRKTGDGTIQGFVTSKDRFVDRKEGGAIAFAAGQIPELTTCLFSEDLY